MNSALILWLALQAAQPAGQPIAPSSGAGEEDVYTACFFGELSRREKRDIRTSAAGFLMKNATKSLLRCQGSKAELAASVERDLARDPAYADSSLRALELQNRVMLAEIPLILLIRAQGR